MKRARWPREACLFRIDAGSEAGRTVEGVDCGHVLDMFPNTLWLEYWSPRGHYDGHRPSNLIPLTPAARAMLAIARGRR